MIENLINVGSRPVQAQHRVYLGNTLCKRYGIEVGDDVEVFIKKTERR